MSANTTIRWVAVTLLAVAALVLIVVSSRPTGKSAEAPPNTATDARAVCADRLAALGRALRVYATDHRGHFPILETPDNADEHLPQLLDAPQVTSETLRCPARPEVPYTYHCYRHLSDSDWPRWVSSQHIVTMHDDPETWLTADQLLRGTKGPHSPTTKAYNFLKVDGSVEFSAGQPRKVYR